MPANETTFRQLAAAKIVAAYVRRNQMPTDQIANLISTVHNSLIQLGKPVDEVVDRTPAVPLRRSVTREYVICLDCGWRGQTLGRHLTIRHGLQREEYRRRWNLPPEHALTAPAYSERRSGLAKQLGLGRRRGSAKSRQTTEGGAGAC
jgi:predicted transcriptional regulator